MNYRHRIIRPGEKPVERRRGIDRRSRAMATDYRAIVLEDIATTPNPGATKESVAKNVLQQYQEYTKKKVFKMIMQLRAEGLIGRGDDVSGNDTEHFFITKIGLDWLTYGVFGKQPPSEHTRPGARHPRALKKK